MEERGLYIVETEDLMAKKIRIKVPQLLEERGLTPMDLMYGARLSPSTAYALADIDKSEKLKAMSFDVLARLCQYLNAGVQDILELQDNGEDLSS